MTIEQIVLTLVIGRPGYCTRALFMRYCSGITIGQLTEALRRLQSKGLIWKSDNPQGGWYHRARTKPVSGWLTDPYFGGQP